MAITETGDSLYESRYDALYAKYTADVAICKAELRNYFNNSVGVAEHPHTIESMDQLMNELTSAEERLDHCDENKTPHSTTYTEKEYKKEFNKWLLEKYAEQKDNT